MYASYQDLTADGTKSYKNTNLKNLRMKQRCTKKRYKCIPLATRRAHIKLATADQTAVTTQMLVFAPNHPSSKIPGGYQGDELDFARHCSVSRKASEVAHAQPVAEQWFSYRFSWPPKVFRLILVWPSR